MFRPFKIFGIFFTFLVSNIQNCVLCSNIQNDCMYSAESSQTIYAKLPFEIDFYIPINWREESLNIDIGDNKLKLSNSEWRQSNENEEIIQINDTYVKLGWNKIIVVAANQNSVKIIDVSGNIWIDEGKQVIEQRHKIYISISGLFSVFNCKSDTRTFRMTTKTFTIPLIFQNDVSFLSFHFSANYVNTQNFSLKAKFSQKVLSVCPIQCVSKNCFIFNETCSSRKRFQNYETYSSTFGPKYFKIEYVKISNFSYAQIEIKIETEIVLTIKTRSYGNERAPIKLHSFSLWKNQHVNHAQVESNDNFNPTQVTEESDHNFNHSQVTEEPDDDFNPTRDQLNLNNNENKNKPLTIAAWLAMSLAMVGLVVCCVVFIKKKTLRPKFLYSTKQEAINQDSTVDSNQQVSEQNDYSGEYELANPHYVSFDVRNLQTSALVSSSPSSSASITESKRRF